MPRFQTRTQRTGSKSHKHGAAATAYPTCDKTSGTPTKKRGDDESFVEPRGDVQPGDEKPVSTTTVTIQEHR
jgi:hypothetical protein